jgi:hypothetical protein
MQENVQHNLQYIWQFEICAYLLSNLKGYCAMGIFIKKMPNISSKEQAQHIGPSCGGDI